MSEFCWRQVAQYLSVRMHTHSEWFKESRGLVGKLFCIEKQHINIFQKKSPEACLVVKYRKETSGTQIKDEFATAA